MENSLISVIIPVYNVESYIKQCVDSVTGQTYTNLQIILVDDGSTDSCGKICDEYAAADKRITVIHQENGGLSSARNSGIEAAAGDYIIFVDGDDWIDADTCEKALAAAETHNTDVVLWSYIREFSHNSMPKYSFGEEDKLFEGEDYRKVYKRLIGPVGEETAIPQNMEMLSSACTKMYKRLLINELRFFPTSVVGSEDIPFNTAYFSKAKSLYYIGKCFYHYRKSDSSSITHIYQLDFYEKRKRMYEVMRDIVSENGDGEFTREAFNNRIAIDVLGCGLNICRKNNLSYGEKKLAFKKILDDPVCSGALRNFDYKYMPVYWRMFYRFAKKGRASALVMMCSSIQFLRSKL